MSKTPKPRITIQSYNPYEARYPGLRVVSRETLHLIKTLRSNGYEITVEPNDGTKLCYLTEKGLREFLSDPIIATVVGVSLSLIINLISSWIYDRLKHTPRKEDEINLILEFDENGHKVRYNHSGQEITDDRFKEILASLNDRARLYKESIETTLGDLPRPYPIYLEHSYQIVGWAEKVIKDDTGLKITGIKIIDNETWMGIVNEELTGLSIGGIVRKSRCSICKRDYVECNHIAAKKYHRKECTVRIDDILLGDFSIVKTPIQPMARIQFVKD